MDRVLLIDDDETLRTGMQLVLEESDFEVQSAGDGPSGLALLSTFSPLVILCDLEMPKMNGLEVLRQIRATDTVTPVLILTGNDRVPTVVQAMRDGAYGYLLKGGSEALLAHELREAIKYRRMLERTRELEIANHNYQQRLESMVDEKTAHIARLERSKAQAGKMVALGTVAAGVAHEINNPLAIVTSGLTWVADALPAPLTELGSLLEQRGTDSGSAFERIRGLYKKGIAPQLNELRSVITEASDAIARIQRIVASVKRLSHAPAGTSFCSASRAISQAQLTCHGDLLGIDVQVAVPEDIDELPLSFDDCVTVVTNVLQNSAQALSKKGSVRVELVRSEAGRVRLKVTDTGSGIAAEHLPRVCEPFFTTRRPGPSTGLGMYLVHQIVEAAGGQVNIVSQLGVGTTVMLDFPEVVREVPVPHSTATAMEAAP